MGSIYSITHNPDVLNCLANLSSDEVFTPPEIANRMLDMLPEEIWSDKTSTFLDPACKSGVFLREIAKRLIKGLKDQIPDEQERCDHIFHNQLYGIAITELTSLLSRRSIYCSKNANSKYSISSFDNSKGNIRFKEIKHTWKKGKCKYCGAPQSKYERDDDFETHAYELIHTIDPKEIFKMKFDVIIGNPPYQLNTGGAGRQARPIYPIFVEQSKKLNPRFLIMITPSRWFAGGMGLDGFRETMLKDSHIRCIVDYSNAKDCFPENSISGGVSYFLWSRDSPGPCNFVSIKDGNMTQMERSLNEFPVLIRYNDAVNIVRQIESKKTGSLSEIVSSLTPFGLPTYCRGVSESQKNSDSLRLFSSEGISFIEKREVSKGHDLIKKHKVIISKTSAEHAGEPDKSGKYRVLTKSIKVIGPDDVCTHSYFVVGGGGEQESLNLLSYLKTKFVRFLILQSMSSINLSKSVFNFVPMEDFSKEWIDAELYKKYELNDEEVAFIESLIRPMETERGDKD